MQTLCGHVLGPMVMCIFVYNPNPSLYPKTTLLLVPDTKTPGTLATISIVLILADDIKSLDDKTYPEFQEET